MEQLQTLIAHWDGTKWSVVQSPNRASLNNELSGVAAVSANDIWAVGSAIDNSSGTAQTLIEHWDGTQWSIIPSPDPGQIAYLQGVTAISPNNIWAVGTFVNATNPGQTLVEQWNGTSWNVIPSPNPGGINNKLEAVTGVSADDIWAVGLYVANQSPVLTLIERWNGTSWSIVPNSHPGQDSEFLGVMNADGNHVWAVGHYFNPGEKTLIESYCQ